MSIDDKIKDLERHRRNLEEEVDEIENELVALRKRKQEIEEDGLPVPAKGYENWCRTHAPWLV